jgi:hypothetical protein
MEPEKPPVKRSLLPAIGLFFVAPLVAEFLLGNLPIKLLMALVMLAPMYGGGALLIRELVRRAGRGWPSIVLLALAYGIFEEAFATQSLFNPNYMHLNLHLLQPSFIPALGIGAWWTIFVLALHMVWSISVPIALVEATVPGRAETPWLGGGGLAIIGLLFGVGVAGMTAMTLKQDRFMSSTGQFATAAAILVLLAIAAFAMGKPAVASIAGSVPNPWLCGGLALASGSAILLLPGVWGWWAAAAILLLELAVGALVLAWSRRTAWNSRHKVALAGGAALAYAWHAFIETPVIGGAGVGVRVGNVVFALGALALIAYGMKTTSSAKSLVAVA